MMQKVTSNDLSRPPVRPSSPGPWLSLVWRVCCGAGLGVGILWLL